MKAATMLSTLSRLLNHPLARYFYSSVNAISALQAARSFATQRLPSQCLLCQLPLHSDKQKPHITQSGAQLWCQYCLRYFAPHPRCQQCGLPMPQPHLSSITTATEPLAAQNPLICGQCLRRPPPWQRLFCLGDHQYPLSYYVSQFKYQRQVQYAAPLAKLLSSRITEPAPLLTCVPLHWRRYCQRGFNQSELLAAALQHDLAVECQFQPAMFCRHRATQTQQGLDRQQRLHNLNNAFALNMKPSSEHVAIVDDVVTTGSTVRHLCQLLLAVGVKKIDIYCICRTPEPKR